MQRGIVRALLAVLAIAITGAAMPGIASAQQRPDDWGCEAQPLEASLVGFDIVKALGLLTANGDRTPCVDDEAPLDALNDALEALQPLGVTVAAVEADTVINPDTRPGYLQSTLARANVAGLKVSLLNALDIVEVHAAESSVIGKCVNGVPSVVGASNIGDVFVGGHALDLDLDQPVTVVGDLVNGLVPGVVVRITPNQQTNVDGVLTQTALRIEVLSAIGTPLLDLSVSRATVSSGSVVCPPPPTVKLLDAGENRKLAASVVPATGLSITACEFDVTPAGGGTKKTVTGTFVDGLCTATLPAAGFPVGQYDIVAKGYDNAARVGTASGAVTIAAPTVGTPTVNGREVMAPVTAPPGTTITECSFKVTPTGKPAVTLNGTYDPAGLCRAALPDSVPAGEAVVVVTATDSQGGSGTGSGVITVGEVPAGPSVAIIDSGDNRAVAATVTDGTGGPATSCAMEIRPLGSTADFAPLTATLANGRCTADLPATFPAGQAYEVHVVATDADNRVGQAIGTKTIARPAVGPASVDDRTISAPVVAAPGTTISSCTITLTPKGGGAATVVPATYDAAHGLCTGDAPDAVPAGTYDVAVTATDDNADTGSGSGQGTLGPKGGSFPPKITIVPGLPNREAAAQVEVTPGRSVATCAATVTPTAGGTPVAVPAHYEASTGRCVADLPAGSVPPGSYKITFTTFDSEGESASATGPITVATPTLGTPETTPTDVSVPVTPATGAPIVSCRLTIQAAGGQLVVLNGTYDSATGRCVAPLPSGFPTGDATVTATVTDVNGDTATKSGPVTVPAAADNNNNGGGGGGGGNTNSNGTGGTGATTTGASAPNFTTGTVTDLLLGCALQKLVLTDVRREGNKARIIGIADPALVGKTVTLVFGDNAAKVGTATVAAGGAFTALVRLPAAAARNLNTSRYQARVGGEYSRRLKYARRVTVSGLSQSGNVLKMTGRTTSPVARKGTKFSVQRLIGCGKYQTVATGKIKSNGGFSASFAKPAAVAAIYRIQTQVPKSKKKGSKTSRTFSLPTPVTFR